jgi:hypothetical protein
MTVQTLTSLALLQALDDEGQDYIDLFLPFVEVALGHCQVGQPVTDLQAKDWLFQEFGLVIPQASVNVMLKRLKNRGYLRRVAGQFVLSEPVKAREIFLNRRQQFNEKQKQLFTAIKQYALNKFTVKWDDVESYDAFLDYMNVYGINSISSYRNRDTKPAKIGAPDHSRYVISAFINDIQESAPQIFQIAVDTIKGKLLANGLLCTELDSRQHNLEGTTFYFDSVLVMRALGYEGKIHQDAMMDLVGLLRLNKATLAIFEHTFDEIIGIFNGIEEALRQGRKIPRASFDHFFNSGSKPSDVALERENLKISLASIGLKITPRPVSMPESIARQAALNELLERRMNYKSEIAQNRDIQSIDSVYQLRGTHRPRTLEDASATFVTSNSPLVSIATEYAKSDYVSRDVSPALTDYELTNIVWLKSPQKRPNTVEHMVISNCAAALDIPDRLWDAVVDHLEKQRGRVISKNVYDYFLYSPRVKRELADATFGGEKEFSPQTLDEIIELAKTEFSEPYQREIDTREVERQALTQVLDKEKQLNDELVNRMVEISHIIAWTISILLLLPLLLLLGYATLIQLLESIAPSREPVTVITGLALGILLAISLISLLTGGSVKLWLLTFKSYIFHVSFMGLAKVFHIPQDRWSKSLIDT